MPTHGSLPAGVDGDVARAGPAGQRCTGQPKIAYLDNLKLFLIAAVIAVHGILGYSTLEVWTYTSVREVTLSPVVEGALFVLVAPFGLFMMAVLFLVAGLLTPPSVDRKGPARFAADRGLRLGVPFAAYVLLVQPTLVKALKHHTGGSPGTFGEEYLGGVGQLDTGPLWFVGVLLVFSLGYAAWAGARLGRPVRASRAPVSARRLALAVAVVAPLSFLVRLAYPYGGESGFTDLNFWQWPACLAVFGLGVVASRQGWLGAVPDALSRRCRTVTLVGVAAMVLLALALGMLDQVEAARGGWGWPAAAFAAVESLLNLFGPVWLLAVAQRHLDRPEPLLIMEKTTSTRRSEVSFSMINRVRVGRCLG